MSSYFLKKTYYNFLSIIHLLSKPAAINPILQKRPRICNRESTTAHRQRRQGHRHPRRAGAAGRRTKDPHPAATRCWRRRQLRCCRRRIIIGGWVQVLDCWFFPAPVKGISIIRMAARAAKQLQKLMTGTRPLISQDPPEAFAPFVVLHCGSHRHRITRRMDRKWRSWIGKSERIAVLPVWPKGRPS